MVIILILIIISNLMNFVNSKMSKFTVYLNNIIVFY